MVSAREIAATTPDPELPFLTIADLGILREVAEQDGRATVVITPTYSGCPAMREIAADVHHRLHQAGYDADVRTRLTPAWTTDWITEDGRRKLAEAGIAPPNAAPTRTPLTLTLRRHVDCPHCGSRDTVETAAFSGTACKALYRCRACSEPFEYIKEH